MIRSEDFFACLKDNGLDFFAGVPDSLLKSPCAYLADNAGDNYIITANEGNAVAAAAGHYLATGRAGVVFMQNSGIGNAVNPLLSLADEKVYDIPMLLITGWRGEPNVHDEPQHKKQGEITLSLYKTMGIEAVILSDDFTSQIAYCAEKINTENRRVALIVKSGTFAPYTPKNAPFSEGSITREQALQAVCNALSADDVIVSSTGKASRELYEIRERSGSGHAADFLTVGSMGHASSIALGISLSTRRRVFCIDGDGAFLMHMGAAAVNAQSAPENYRYIIINNGAHESVGGQKTVCRDIDMKMILEGCGWRNVADARTAEQLSAALKNLSDTPRGVLVIYTNTASRADLGRPKESPVENKKLFMQNLKRGQT